MSDQNKIEIVARILCEQMGLMDDKPDNLEPGSCPCVDGITPNGDPGHYRWRDFESNAKEILQALERIK